MANYRIGNRLSFRKLTLQKEIISVFIMYLYKFQARDQNRFFIKSLYFTMFILLNIYGLSGIIADLNMVLLVDR